jgi:hypothetical protein
MQTIATKCHSRGVILSWLLAAANGCTGYTVVGVSGQTGPDALQPSAAEVTNGATPGQTGSAIRSSAKHQTVIALAPGVRLTPNHGNLGDIDGDGFDDFFVPTGNFDEMGSGASGLDVYLFYGKPELAMQLSTADADAVFSTPTDMCPLSPLDMTAWPLGDVNGDGLADFSLMRANGAEIVFGSSTRYAGEHLPFSSGLRWEADSPIADAFPTMSHVRGAGDVNGDGLDDLLVTILKVAEAGEEANAWSGSGDGTLDLAYNTYLVLGRSSDWPTGPWSSSWAIAKLGSVHGAPRGFSPTGSIAALEPAPIGDLDGDGYADLLGFADQSCFLFYGGKDKLVGDLAPERADAQLALPPKNGAPPSAAIWFNAPERLGDLDGDGAADMLVTDYDGLGVVYGTRERWSGPTSIKKELAIHLDGSSSLWGTTAGDIDSDGLPDLLVGGPLQTNSSDPSDPVLSDLYVIRGSGVRPTGAVSLTDGDKLIRDSGGPSSATISALGTLVTMAGDIDGDGSADVLTLAKTKTESGDEVSAAIVIPSTPMSPK